MKTIAKIEAPDRQFVIFEKDMPEGLTKQQQRAHAREFLMRIADAWAPMPCKIIYFS